MPSDRRSGRASTELPWSASALVALFRASEPKSPVSFRNSRPPLPPPGELSVPTHRRLAHNKRAKAQGSFHNRPASTSATRVQHPALARQARRESRTCRTKVASQKNPDNFRKEQDDPYHCQAPSQTCRTHTPTGVKSAEIPAISTPSPTATSTGGLRLNLPKQTFEQCETTSARYSHTLKPEQPVSTGTRPASGCSSTLTQASQHAGIKAPSQSLTARRPSSRSKQASLTSVVLGVLKKTAFPARKRTGSVELPMRPHATRRKRTAHVLRL